MLEKDEHTHLGKIMDSNLNFNSDVREAIIKARRGIGIIRYLSKYVSTDVLDQIYKLYARLHLRKYHLDRLSPPRLTPRPLIFSVKIPTPGTAFLRKTPAPGSKKETKSPPLRENLSGSNAKISVKREHNCIQAVSFQIFHNCSFDNFLFS